MQVSRFDRDALLGQQTVLAMGIEKRKRKCAMSVLD
jgi:hypothetical protein